MFEIILIGLRVAALFEFTPEQTEAFMRLGWLESKYCNVRVGDDVGPWQVNLSSWALNKWQVSTDDPMNMLASIHQAGYIFNLLLERYDGHIYTSAAAFTIGHGAVDALREEDYGCSYIILSDPYEQYALFAAGQESFYKNEWRAWSWTDAVDRELEKMGY